MNNISWVVTVWIFLSFAENQHQRNQEPPMVLKELAEGTNRASSSNLLQERKPHVFPPRCWRDNENRGRGQGSSSCIPINWRLWLGRRRRRRWKGRGNRCRGRRRVWKERQGSTKKRRSSCQLRIISTVFQILIKSRILPIQSPAQLLPCGE